MLEEGHFFRPSCGEEERRGLLAVFFHVGQHGVCPDGITLFRKVQVVPADAGQELACGVQKALVDIGVGGAGQFALGQDGIDFIIVLAQLVLRPRAAGENAQQEHMGVREPDQQVPTAPRMPMAVFSGASPALKWPVLLVPIMTMQSLGSVWAGMPESVMR